MKKYLVCFMLLYPMFAYAEEKGAEESNMLVELMVVAKATGMCGVFAQMTTFQQATKMPGGDEFIVRFLQTEAARLGHSLDSFLEQCPIFVDKYTQTMEALGADL